jgi:hypothetical protein
MFLKPLLLEFFFFFLVEGQLFTPTDAFDAKYRGFIAIFILQVLFMGLVDLCLKMFSR